MITVLGKKTIVSRDPFPHVVIANAVDNSVVERLIAEFPSPEVIIDGRSIGADAVPIESGNVRFSYHAGKALQNPRISEFWKDFVRAHISQHFLGEILDLFKDDIRERFPRLEERHGKIESWKAGVRGVDENADVLLEAQISINTPSKGGRRVRGVHIDKPDKLFAGLFYLRHPDDDSKGGNLELYRWKGKRVFWDKQWTEFRYVERVGEVPYRSNTLVLFLNSPDSLHGVTVREKTDFPRLFLNLDGEMRYEGKKEYFFSTGEFRETFTQKVRRKLKERVRGRTVYFS
ncbi:hypothetical protein A3D66_02175 [Candidatus Kaiserbacteria bacterium RIFCSPHIGHO2_02_FULL_50_9]|uniref:Prolyl 4-hydroxylase alpha subunit Fe(2+) 2OG dioxygenase domain-containing protein n=1 Tax=Candidatus Kaiserbacteria bacterium RIFCSPLOWO2_01_FULL_51_21 TaxID=1798508 RepID=A0A1F6EED0_9BACT|nr:MAG: hypothetical protein A2761_03450 [Candidatus Kaiserbacteria bacterium RIFCSPHIGHO2_01_FULL_51_33]OGG63410.1 MAG: hypothetical protein A3D66_02175 [Candidatus Kaiserbacteria bacterium RIFCSPHIGHO2_02_FULL_50_9]OGG72006.1 MAG: hypothetical protein A3A35_01280 [Candidatus Kaiserbacteria bacterium RIFCSPLOWO2_01_FULL_51_21]